MTKQEMDKLRSSILYDGELLDVVCIKDYGNFKKGVIIKAFSRFVCKSGLPYPYPKWEACDWYVRDLDGELFKVADFKHKDIVRGFKWVR